MWMLNQWNSLIQLIRSQTTETPEELVLCSGTHQRRLPESSAEPVWRRRLKIFSPLELLWSIKPSQLRVGRLATRGQQTQSHSRKLFITKELYWFWIHLIGILISSVADLDEIILIYFTVSIVFKIDSVLSLLTDNKNYQTDSWLMCRRSIWKPDERDLSWQHVTDRGQQRHGNQRLLLQKRSKGSIKGINERNQWSWSDLKCRICSHGAGGELKFCCSFSLKTNQD